MCARAKVSLIYEYPFTLIPRWFRILLRLWAGIRKLVTWPVPQEVLTLCRILHCIWVSDVVQIKFPGYRIFILLQSSSYLKYFVIIVTYRCLRKSVELLYFIVCQLLTDSCLEESMKMLIPYGAHRYRGKSSDGNADLFKNVRWFGKFRVFRNEIRTISPVRPPPSPVTTGWLLNGRSHENGKRTKTKIEQLCFSSEFNTHWLKITKCNFQTIIPCDTSFRTRSQFSRRKYLYLEIRS